MKKLIISLILITLVTGCSFKYEIKISRNTVKELDSLINTDKSTWNNEDYLIAGEKYKEKVNSYVKIPQPVYNFTPVDTYDEYAIFEDGDYYKSKIISNDKNYGIEYSYKHKINDFKETRLLKLCYDDIKIVNNNKTFSIETSDEFNCFDDYEFLDEVEINITTSYDYKVVSSNADKVEDGKYIWYIKKDSADSKPIKIELKKVFNWPLALLIGIPTLSLATVVYFIINKRIKNNNQI